jgi:hypothetical protein
MMATSLHDCRIHRISQENKITPENRTNHASRFAWLATTKHDTSRGSPAGLIPCQVITPCHTGTLGGFACPGFGFCLARSFCSIIFCICWVIMPGDVLIAPGFMPMGIMGRGCCPPPPLSDRMCPGGGRSVGGGWDGIILAPPPTSICASPTSCFMGPPCGI